MTAWILVAVAAGGLVGAPARYLVDRLVTDRLVAGGVATGFPLGTFTVNITGAFLLGVLAGLGIAHHLPAVVQALLGTGFCGAYTTFSTWSYETARLLETGDLLRAFLNAAASLLVGLLAAGAGLALGLLR